MVLIRTKAGCSRDLLANGRRRRVHMGSVFYGYQRDASYGLHLPAVLAESSSPVCAVNSSIGCLQFV